MLHFFSPDYATARSRFTESARSAGAKLESFPLKDPGPNGEELAIDVAWFGSSKPRQALVHSSGLHGVEGFAGSAIQLSLLQELPDLTSETAVVFVHVLNPYGMAWLRRVNENNVDLNRNCLVDGTYSGAPDGYRKLNALLNPRRQPSFDLFLARAVLLIVRYGLNALKQSVAGGQYEFPGGLFFGGHAQQKGIEIYEGLLRRMAAVERLTAIDVHTGLGPYSKDTLLVSPEDLAAMRQAFGERVSPLVPEKGPAYRVTGGLESILFDRFPRPRGCFIGQEFGTFGPVKVLGALRQENCWHQYGTGSISHPSKERLREVFFPSDESWQRAVVSRGRELLNVALRELLL